MTETEVDLDIQMLEGLRDLLADKFTELVETFNSDGARRLCNMREGVASTDFSVINHEAHGVKGSSRNIGANTLAQLCSKMESKARDEDGEDMEQLLSAIEQEFAAVIAKLNSLI